MTDDLTKKRAERMDKLTLLQELYYVVHRNALEMVDAVLKRAIKLEFTGPLEMRVEPEANGQRADLRVTLRLRRPHDRPLPGSKDYPVDPGALRDMYERLKADPETQDGPVRDELVVNAETGEAGEWKSTPEVDRLRAALERIAIGAHGTSDNCAACIARAALDGAP